MTWSKTDIRNAHPAPRWNMKPSGSRSVTLTYYESATEQNCAKAKKGFHAKTASSSFSGTPSIGFEGNITGYFMDGSTLYVQTIGMIGNEGICRLYRLLTSRLHETKKKQTIEYFTNLLSIYAIPQIQ